MWAKFMEGWNDGTAGPLLPTIQRFYKIGFTVISLIFVFGCTGFISGAVANITLAYKLGFGKALCIGALSQLLAYCIQAFGPPFLVFALAYIFSGFGIALQNAQSTCFVVNLNNHSAAKMGLLHASYGTGALVAPLVATQFSTMRHWSFHFLASLGGAAINVLCLFLVFKLQPLNTILETTGQTVRQQTVSQDNHYSQILKMKVVHLIAFFILAYVGVEVTIGGWIVTFVINERGGGASSGYLSSGFFAGLTLGRICLLWLNKVIGVRRVIWLYILLSIGLEITIWFVPSLVENAIAVAFVGLFLGPIYPIVMTLTGHLVPNLLVSGAVGWIAVIGQAGSSLLPFISGAMASKFGVMSLQPLVVTVLGVMVGLWAVVPPDQHHSD
ncbi:MFS general substrate transporter [Fomitiporia mediterranea MF3/22]|uniref:MFS general substrate transporter n=1 Tax=Fomitiporia mediterranea (strain MF3/22) TaxID=694068 RepID=UPI0004408965|nr:MFS general substrate transporter [Fomitiporia mediterranea MF3/22]EJC99148.1 MFS general substrate transporter [Fomitiporia mediterranea MF3/22]